MSDTIKPNVFIGSSREAIDYADAVHSSIQRIAQVTPWYTDTFGPNEYTMESLEKALDVSDFGIFIFAPDDVALYRNKYVFITRDNTLFEMGLFIGKLKLKRVFAIVPDGVTTRDDLIEGQSVKEFHLLSDLQGINLLRYEQKRTDTNYEAAVSVACRKIIREITDAGNFQDPLSILAEKELELAKKQSLLHFFWDYNRNVMSNPTEKYSALSEAVRNSMLLPDGFRVTGAAFWQKQGNDGIKQVGGNVGKGRFYDFSRPEGAPVIFVLDAYHSGKWSFFTRQELAEVCVLCYPLGTDHVLSVHFSGRGSIGKEQLTEIISTNNDLLRTLNHLIGGDSL